MVDAEPKSLPFDVDKGSIPAIIAEWDAIDDIGMYCMDKMGTAPIVNVEHAFYLQQAIFHYKDAPDKAALLMGTALFTTEQIRKIANFQGELTQADIDELRDASERLEADRRTPDDDGILDLAASSIKMVSPNLNEALYKIVQGIPEEEGDSFVTGFSLSWFLHFFKYIDSKS